MRFSIAFPFLLIAVLTAAGAARAGVEDIKTPRGESVRLLVEKPDNPWVTVVLFAGGAGVLDLSETGAIGKLGGNFLLRARDQFRKAGAVTVSIDSPSDRRQNMFNFRDTENHARDVGAVVKHLRAKYALPVWLVGTSRGTESVANAGARLSGVSDGPNGIVLTSSVTHTSKRGTSVLSMNIDRIAIPTLIAHHKSDTCRETPPDKVEQLKNALKNAKPVKVLWYEGGSGVEGDPCRAFHYHGFRGIEDRVIADVMAWIKNPAP